MKRIALAILIGLSLGAIVDSQNSRGTPAQIRINIDDNGAINVRDVGGVVMPVVTVPFLNARLNVDSDGNLLVNGMGGGGGFDPSMDYNITGMWKFNPIPSFFSGGTTGGTYTIDNSSFFISSSSSMLMGWIYFSDPNISDFNSVNLYIGLNAGANQPSDNTSAGYGNLAIGYQSLEAISTGYYNIALGYDALLALDSGDDNIGIGNFSAGNLNSGYFNIAIGESSLQGGTSATYNIAIGANALNGLDSGSYNTAVGYAAGFSASSTETNLTFIGPNTDTDVMAAYSNSFALGNGAVINASNIGVFGNGSLTDIYAGSSLASANIHGATFFPTVGYKSVDGTTGVTVTTCTGFKNGLCISGT